MESNTKFGIALIVLLVGTLCFVVYKKMENRRTALAQAGGAETEGADVGKPAAAYGDGRRATGTRRSTAYEEHDAPLAAGAAPPQQPSEPSAADASRSRAVAYRPHPSPTQAASELAENPFDRAAVHPLRRTNERGQVAAVGRESNPFGADQAATGAAPVQSRPAQAAGAKSLFDGPAAVSAQSGPTSTPGAAGPRTDSSTTFDPSIRNTDGGFEPATKQAAADAQPDGSTASQVQIQAAAATTIQAVDASQVTAASADDPPWSLHDTETATQAVAAPVPESPAFSPVQRGFEHVPHAAPPTRAAIAAEDSPWGALESQAPPPVHAGGTNSNPFNSPPFVQRTAPAAAAATSQQIMSRPSELDFAGPTGVGQSFARPEDRPGMYVVQPGDTYWTISRTEYGTSRYFRALALYNTHRIPDPRRMRVGMKVLVPAREILDSRFPQVLPRRAGASAASRRPAGLFQNESGETLYRVGRNETLGGIAQRHLGRSSRWAEIFQLNRDRLASPTALKTGMELRLPADASRVRMVSETTERR